MIMENVQPKQSCDETLVLELLQMKITLE